MNAVLVTDILSNALQRKYDREIAVELLQLGRIVVDAEAEARVWTRIEAQLKAKGRTGEVRPFASSDQRR